MEGALTAVTTDVVRAAELPVSSGVCPVKKRAKPWSAPEEIILIQEVLANEDLLFSELKGPASKAISRRRWETWAGIAEKITSHSADAKRDGDEVKKKYFNLKQRAKQKIDEQRKVRGKTGGGPAPPPLSSAEEALVGSMEGRPVLSGLPNGIDTDAVANTVADKSDGQEGGSNTEADVEYMYHGEKRKTGHTEKCQESDRKKRKSIEQEQNIETLKNTKLDTERIILKNEKLTLEIEKLKTEILSIKKRDETFSSLKAMAETVTVYYQQQIGIDLMGQNINLNI